MILYCAVVVRRSVFCVHGRLSCVFGRRGLHGIISNDASAKVRHLPRPTASQTKAVNPEIRITKSIYLRKASKLPKNAASINEKPPVVLFLSWLAAKPQHLSVYARFYLNQGCDVLTVKTKPIECLLPELGAQVIAGDVVRFIQDEERREQPIVVHGFSAGGYFYTEILRKMISLQKEDEITSRIVAQIFDSTVDIGSVSRAIPMVLLNRRAMPLQYAMRKTIDGYLRMTHRFAGVHHARGSQLFHNNPVNSPYMFFYSDADPISSPETNKRFITELKKNMGHTSVQGVEFKDSPHVCHMQKHREDYISALQSFLNQVDYFKKIHV